MQNILYNIHTAFCYYFGTFELHVYNAFNYSIATQVPIQVTKVAVLVAIASTSLFIIVTTALVLTLVPLMIARRKLGN